MKTILKDAFNLLSAQQRRKGVSMIALLVLHSLLDFFSLAFFLPAILVVVQPDLIQKNIVLHGLYESLDFLNVAQFGIALVVGVFIFILAKTWINQWITFRKASFVYDIACDLALRVVDFHFTRTYVEFAQSDFSKEVNRMVSSPLAFANNVIIPAGTLFSESIVFLMILIATAVFDFTAFMLVCVMLVPAVIIYSRRKKVVSEISANLAVYYPFLLKRGFEITEGQVDIRSFQKEQFFRQNFIKAHEALDKILAKEHTIQTGTARITEIVGAACVCAIMIYAIAVQTASGKIVVLLSVYAAASFRIIPSVNRILSSMHHIRINKHVVESLSGLGSTASKNQDSDVSFLTSIVINDVSYHYPGQSELIHIPDLEIRRGEKIAITGPSGKGKTTLLLMLLGYLRPTSGQLVIDGKILDETTAASWRKRIGYIPQRPYVLDGSIASNIAFGDYSPDFHKIAELTKSLELDQWISTLPQGVHTEIGERGVKVSGGQLQRISIARALYRSPEILVLDEVTNQLDPSTEAGIFKSLINVSAGKTLIMVTHNHEVLGQFDRRLEVKGGYVVEQKTSLDQVS